MIAVLRKCGWLLVLVAVSTQAEIYVYEGPDGERIVSDRPIRGHDLVSRRDTVEGAGQLLAYRPANGASRADVEAWIRIASRHHKVDPDLVRAVVHVESSFDPNAYSSAGAAGLMQLMLETAREYDVTDRHDPRQNIHAGTQHLSKLLTRYGDLRLALAAYNAGAGAVDQYGGIPPYPETERYVVKVMQRHAELKRRGTSTD